MDNKNLEDNLKQALIAELQRQAEAGELSLKISANDPGALTIQGEVDLDELAMALVGALAGGP